MEMPEIPLLHDLSPSASALSDSDNKRVSGFSTSCLRYFAQIPLRGTSDTLGALCEIATR